jgi:hypothetical protein
MQDCEYSLLHAGSLLYSVKYRWQSLIKNYEYSQRYLSFMSVKFRLSSSQGAWEQGGPMTDNMKGEWSKLYTARNFIMFTSFFQISRIDFSPDRIQN